jgi:hypothetical protein
MRKDVIAGILELYGYEEEILEADRAEKARYLVMKSLRSKRFTPWSISEKAMLQRVVNTLEGGGHTKDEVLDIAVTCVYDAHVRQWLLGGDAV